MPLDFKKLMSARFLFTFGVQMQAVVIGWRMYALTHDPLYLGFIGLSEAIPALSLALFAGMIVDRSRPLRVFRLVGLGIFVSGLVLLVSQIPALNLNDKDQVIALFLSSFITGVARGFSQPSVYAIVPRIVKRADLARSSAWMTASWQIASISGPAIGGVIFGWAGMLATAYTICAFLLAGMIVLSTIQSSPTAPARPKTREPIKKELLSGASFVFRHPILLPALTLDMVSVFFGGVTALLPIYAADILMVGPKGLGALRAAPAIGAAIMGIFLIRLDIRERSGTYLFWCVAGFGACMMVFGISRDLTLSIVALGLSGAFDCVSMVIRTSAVQMVSPDNMRGRISAVNSIFIGSSNELGEMESGLAAKLMGTVNSVIFGASICLATVALAALWSPALRRLNLKQLEAETSA